MTWSFDPPQDLTATEFTQILREIFKNIPDEQKATISDWAPTIGMYLVLVDEVS